MAAMVSSPGAANGATEAEVGPGSVALAAAVMGVRLMNMAARSRFILGVAALEPETRLLVTLLVQVVKELRVGSARERAGLPVQFGKDRLQVGFRLCGRHRADRFLQFDQGLQETLFYGAHLSYLAQRPGETKLGKVLGNPLRASNTASK